MISKVKAIFGCSLACLASLVMAENVLMSQNFDSGFQPGILKGTAKNANCTYTVHYDTGSMEIVNGGKSSPYALKVGRKAGPGFIILNSAKPVPRGNDFRVSFDVRFAPKNHVTVFIGGKNQPPLGAINISDMSILRGYNENKLWVNSGLAPLPQDQWIRVSVNFKGSMKTYDVSVTYPDGSVKTGGRDFPFLNEANVSDIRFINAPPVGSSYLIDNVTLEDLGKNAAPKIENGVVLDQNFDKDFPVAAIPVGSGSFPGGKWVLNADANNYSVVADQAKSKPNSLKVMRDGKNGYFALRPQFKIPAKHDYTIEFNAFAPPASGTVLQFVSESGMLGGVLVQSKNYLQGYNFAASWDICNKYIPKLPVSEWVNIKIKVNVNQSYYTVDVTFPDGKVYHGTAEHPLLAKGNVSELRFVNILPQKSFAFIDDVKIYYDENISFAGRDNYTPQSTSSDAAFENMLKGKGVYNVSDKTVEVELSPAATINTLLFSGKKLSGKVTITAANAGGHQISVCKDMVIPSNGLLEFQTADQITKLSLQFKDFAGASLSSLGIFSPIKAPQSELDRKWRAKIDAEYDLPVYDRQYEGCDTANLTFVNHTDTPLVAKVIMHDRLKDKHFRTFNHIIPVGTSNYTMDLNHVPNGEYVTTIIDDSKNGGGKIIRLLRHCTSPENTAVPRKEMTGQKMYFPDNFFLADSKNIRFTTGVVKPYPVKKGTPDNDSWINIGTDMGIDDQGNIVVNYNTMNRRWENSSTKHYHAVGNFNDMTQWQYKEGKAPVLNRGNILIGDRPAAAKPDWHKKRGPDGKITYRFYDPEKDGPIKLNQLQCEFISPSAPGTLGYSDYDWTVMRPSPAHVWTVWYKAPGEALIVGKEPLVSGFPPSGNLEPPNSGSDLHFGQWLSDDGKTLYFGFGRHLIRSSPYRAEYDNMHDRARIVGIWRTTDGVNWDQGYIAPPDKSKPKADQHYGGKDIRLPNGAGLHIAILCRYSAYYQQISWEIVYSWDGFRWTRFQREPQFLAPGPFGSWNHCGGYLSDYAIEHNGKTYQMMLWINDHYHFQSEVVHGPYNTTNSNLHFTADYMKRRYAARGLEKWPFFKEHFDNSWEKLAEHTRNAVSSVGIMEYRYDGFFYATAKEQDARMLTKPVSSSDSLAMNAVIHDGGYIEVSLLDANGKVIDNYSKRFDSGDNTKWQIFENLPQGEFQVELKLKNADIYTLNF